METKDKKRFAEIMMALAENFSSTFSAKLITMFFGLAKNDGVTINQWEDAANNILRTRVYTKMPAYADFYEAIKGTKEDQAEIQANIVLQAVKGGDSEFTDPITKHLMTNRWMVDRLKQTMLEKEEYFFVRDFKTAYTAFSNTNDSLLEIENIPSKIKQIVQRIG